MDDNSEVLIPEEHFGEVHLFPANSLEVLTHTHTQHSHTLRWNVGVRETVALLFSRAHLVSVAFEYSLPYNLPTRGICYILFEGVYP